MQATRERLLDALGTDPSTFRERVARIEGHRTDGAGAVPSFESFDGAAVPGWPTLLERERNLAWQVWVLADAPLGVTLSGAAYEDNPLRYANRTFRLLTGYTMAELDGRNPRSCRGPTPRQRPSRRSTRGSVGGSRSRPNCGTTGATARGFATWCP